VLLLDGVQDPGNVGTLLRTAVAFRWAACALLPGCCDPFNPKAVRAARGACFRLPLWRLASWQQVEQFTATAALDVALLAADPTGDATGSAMRDAVDTCGAGGSLWLALGSEGQGLSDGWQRCCTKIAIPGAGACGFCHDMRLRSAR
jgi:TrmH family RNA methyltransferase